MRQRLILPDDHGELVVRLQVVEQPFGQKVFATFSFATEEKYESRVVRLRHVTPT